MMQPVLFVVPTFNRADQLPRTLGAIAGQRFPADRMSILVVDNGSTDDTAEVIAELQQRLPVAIEHLRKAPEGPTVARNLGLRRRTDGYVALVDSDVELDPGWTAATAGELDADPSLAQVGGKLLFAHDPSLLNSYGGVLGRLGLAWDNGEGQPAAAVNERREVLWVNSSAVLLRPEPVNALGGFDERFFCGYEEPDLGLRLALAGWRSRVVPEAVAVHHTGAQIGACGAEIIFHYNKNRLRMGLKCFAASRLVWYVPASVAYALADASLHAPRRARLSALGWNLRHLGDTLRLRQEIQQRRIVPHRVASALLARRWFPPQRLAGMRRRTVAGMYRAQYAADDRVQP